MESQSYTKKTSLEDSFAEGFNKAQTYTCSCTCSSITKSVSLGKSVTHVGISDSAFDRKNRPHSCLFIGIETAHMCPHRRHYHSTGSARKPSLQLHSSLKQSLSLLLASVLPASLSSAPHGPESSSIWYGRSWPSRRRSTCREGQLQRLGNSLSNWVESDRAVSFGIVRESMWIKVSCVVYFSRFVR